MQISVTFDPVKDPINLVQQAVAAAYGPKLQLDAGAPTTAQPTAAAEHVQLSQTSAPATAAPANPLTAPAALAPSAPAGNGPAGVALDSKGIPWDARIHSGGVNEDGTHKTNKDGSWAKRKGVQDLDVTKVTNELLTLMASQVGHAAPPAGLPAGGVLGNPVNVPHQEAVQVAGQPDAFVIAPMPNMTQLPVAEAAPLAQPAPVMNAPAAMAQGGQSTPGSAAPNVLPPTALPLPTGAPNLMGVAPMPMAPAVPTNYVSLAQWLAPNLAPNGKLTEEHVEHFCRACGIVDGQGRGTFALVEHRPDAVNWLYQAFTNQIAAL